MQVREFRFAFHARDFDKSVAFYRDTLEMATLSGWDRAGGKGALLSAGGSAVVEIYGAAKGKSYDGPTPEGMNLALRVESSAEVDSWHQKLAAAGAEITEEPSDKPWGHRAFTVKDPDGIPLHIYCELS